MSKAITNRKTRRQRSASSRARAFLSLDRIIIGGSILGSLAIVGVIALNSWMNRPIDIQGVERLPSISGVHQEAVIYSQLPPAGGPHASVWQNCGVYLEPVKDAAAVHSLEHGAIWLTYRPGLPDAEVARLREITWQSDSRLLNPYPALPSPIVVTAWGYQLRLDRADDGRLAQFVRQYERAASAPEPTGFCSGGEGQPFTSFMG
ncbi:MAG: hypothetical protein CL610_15490 [Anaerolineaceae bacterium]|nr:hypothetical protein [Anaerolineaceae bacterium]